MPNTYQTVAQQTFYLYIIWVYAPTKGPLLILPVAARTFLELTQTASNPI